MKLEPEQELLEKVPAFDELSVPDRNSLAGQDIFQKNVVFMRNVSVLEFDGLLRLHALPFRI